MGTCTRDETRPSATETEVAPLQSLPVPLANPEGLFDLRATPLLVLPQGEVTVLKPRPSLTRRLLRDLGIGAVLVILLHLFILQVSVVRGSSMSPSLRDGDRLVVDRVSYCVCEVARFDVVVLRYPRNPGVDFVKRVVGLPGDRVELRRGRVLVNGEELPEEFGLVRDLSAQGSFRVPADAFFVLGDNRPISCDSRDFGMVKRELLKGKVRFCFWPPGRIGGI